MRGAIIIRIPDTEAGRMFLNLVLHWSDANQWKAFLGRDDSFLKLLRTLNIITVKNKLSPFTVFSLTPGFYWSWAQHKDEPGQPYYIRLPVYDEDEL